MIYCYPRTGTPGEEMPDGWDELPGARGCTPQACGFRDLRRELETLGAPVFGLSTPPADYQREMAERLHLLFPVLSDSASRLARALSSNLRNRRHDPDQETTLIVRDGVIEHVFYPVFPQDESATEVMHWLATHP